MATLRRLTRIPSTNSNIIWPSAAEIVAKILRSRSASATLSRARKIVYSTVKGQKVLIILTRKGSYQTLAKWDNGAAVEDAPREAKVIADAVKDGEAVGLQEASLANFFRAQIEANKFVQYSLLADWRRSGRAPTHTPINLVGTIRPQLDQMQRALIAELKDTAAIRASTTCPADVAKAVGKYVSEHKHDFGSLQATALDRAMAATCTS